MLPEKPKHSQQSAEHLEKVIHAFVDSVDDLTIRLLGQGNINDTYLVSTSALTFIVQKINGHVFPDPERVADNSAAVASHISKELAGQSVFTFPRVLPAMDGRNWYRDRHGEVWRAQSYIAEGVVYEKAENLDRAVQIGRCLAMFHRATEELTPADFSQVIPGFHDLPAYLQGYDNALLLAQKREMVELGSCFQSIEQMRQYAYFFDDAQKRGDVQQKIIHGDPKVANILFHEASGKAISMIDLDTVGPGLILQDLGDCLRSCCIRKAKENSVDAISCDPQMIGAVMEGYLSVRALSEFELRHLFLSIILITFELGLRFLTDYLQGNTYFKVRYEDENLVRALAQLQLLESIKGHQAAIEEKLSGFAEKKNLCE